MISLSQIFILCTLNLVLYVSYISMKLEGKKKVIDLISKALAIFLKFFIILKKFFKISWRLITLQYCSGFCHTLT